MKRPIIDTTEDRITLAAVADSAAKVVASGSVLCVMRSGILRHTFPVAVAAVDVTLNQDMRALTPLKSLNAYYLAHYLRFTEKTVLETASKDGTTVNSIEAQRLDRHPVPLPPRADQDRIVARIDELFTEIDDGEAALARARSDLATWRKALLKAAVTGELTAGWRAANPPAETGAALLARILADRRARWLAETRNKNKQYREPAGLDAAALSCLPLGWAWACLGQLADIGSGSTPSRANPALWGGEIPWLKSGCVNDSVITTAEESVTELGVREARLRIFPIGTLVVALYGEGKTRGKSAIMDINATINQALGAVQVSKNIEVEWIKTVLDADYEKIRLISSGGVQSNLNLIKLAALPVALPSKKERIAILAEVDTARENMEEFSSVIIELKGSSSNLRQSILAAAFRGHLAA